MGQSARKQKIRWRGTGWWASTPLEHFDPLLSFASQEIQESHWENALWEAMGRERLCDVTTNEGQVKAYASDVSATGERAVKIAPYIPRISGEPATFDRTQALKTKVKRVLNRLIKMANEVHQQRCGRGDNEWLERAAQRDVFFTLKRRGADYSILSWTATHFEERQEIQDTIRSDFNTPEFRSANVHCISGFIEFDNEGEDAAITFAWMLTGLVDVVFREERPILRKCAYCETYFIHKTLKEKKFCSDPCRFNFHNKGIVLHKG